MNADLSIEHCKHWTSSPIFVFQNTRGAQNLYQNLNWVWHLLEHPGSARWHAWSCEQVCRLPIRGNDKITTSFGFMCRGGAPPQQSSSNTNEQLCNYAAGGICSRCAVHIYTIIPQYHADIPVWIHWCHACCMQVGASISPSRCYVSPQCMQLLL